MPLSEFRKKKLLFVFETFFDVDQSGNIDVADLDLAVRRVCEVRGWSESDPKFQQIKATMQKLWEGLKKSGDANHDGQISRDEWYVMWEGYGGKPNEWQQQYMNLVFELEDTSGDGTIDEKEFSQVCRSYGVSDSEARDAFKKLQVGEEFNRAKFEVLWHQFFTSDDPSTPGNFIFGKSSF